MHLDQIDRAAITPMRRAWGAMRRQVWWLILPLAGCGTYPNYLPSSGPSLEVMQKKSQEYDWI
jgi:hypothetical protein